LSDQQYQYTAAWVDCLAKGKQLGRGVFIRGNHAEHDPCLPMREKQSRPVDVPLTMPGFLMNSYAMKLFNGAYYSAHLLKAQRTIGHYNPFFYPLDFLSNWNRLYGEQGLLQYQCVVPHDDRGDVILEILGRIAATGRGSFLGVLKKFGDIRSPGMLSFPRPGITLALDFAYRGNAILHFLDELDDLVRAVGGAVYPAKDARMSPTSFQSFFPQWRTFARFIDPKFSSSFWRRVTCSGGQAVS
jgi:FAD/FMN-containing dehydrogenase